LHQFTFNLLGVFLGGEPHPVDQPPDMSVDHDPSCNVERRTKHDVRRLAADTCEGRESGHISGNLTVVPVDDLPRHRHQIAGFGAKKSGRADHGLEFGWLGPREIRRRGISAEQFRRHEVDTRVCALSREDGCDKKLKRTRMSKGACRVRVGLRECGTNLAALCLQLASRPLRSSHSGILVGFAAVPSQTDEGEQDRIGPPCRCVKQNYNVSGYGWFDNKFNLSSHGQSPLASGTESRDGRTFKSGSTLQSLLRPKPAESSVSIMDFNSEIREFSNHCRLFPLPDVVLFPHALLPLHIFEPRYRQMTEDALAGDRLVTMVQIRSAQQGSPWVEPVPIVDVGCIGKIVQHERLPDGRFNFLLLGCKRVRLNREIITPKLYRVAEAELIEDEEPGPMFEARRHDLITLFRQVLEKRRQLDDDLKTLLDSAVPVGVLSDIIAHALGLPSEMKQTLLAEPNVERRALTLWSILRQVVEEKHSVRLFPPPFSAN
jgi:Lon protease-like protein